MLCFSPSPPHTPHISEPRLVLFLPSTSLWSVPSVAGGMASAQRGYFCPRFLEWTLCTSGFQTCRVSRKKRGKKKRKKKFCFCPYLTRDRNEFQTLVGHLQKVLSRIWKVICHVFEGPLSNPGIGLKNMTRSVSRIKCL